MKHCTNCGALLDNNAKFCTKCGTSAANAPKVKKIELPNEKHLESEPTGVALSKNKIVAISIVAGIVVIVAGTFLFQSVIKPNMDRSSDYKQAIACAGSGDYEQAADIFAYLGDYKDAEQKWAESKIEQAKTLTKAESDYDVNYSEAKNILTEVDAKQGVLSEDGKRKLINLKQQCKNYDNAMQCINDENYSKAKELLQQMDSCPAVEEKLTYCKNELNNIMNIGDTDDYYDDDDYDDEDYEEEEDSEYIIANSSDEYLDDSDVEDLSSRELSLARNEIYARHGRLFESERLQDYFDDLDWYDGRYKEVTDDELSQIERDNIKLIKEYEAENGGAYSWK